MWIAKTQRGAIDRLQLQVRRRHRCSQLQFQLPATPTSSPFRVMDTTLWLQVFPTAENRFRWWIYRRTRKCQPSRCPTKRVMARPLALTDSGVQLAFDNSFVKDVRIAPGSHIGVAAVSENQGVGNTLLYSFDFPGLTIRDSVIIAGQTIETCPAFNCAGDRIYVRTGVGFGSDVIQGFDFDPATGMFNHMAFLTINNLSPTSTSSFGSTLTVSSDDTLLIAPEENQNRVSQFDAVTGNLVSTFTRADLTAPQGVATIPCCAVSPTPTATPSATATPTPTPCTGRCSPTPRPRPTPRARPTPRG